MTRRNKPLLTYFERSKEEKGNVNAKKKQTFVKPNTKRNSFPVKQNSLQSDSSRYYGLNYVGSTQSN